MPVKASQPVNAPQPVATPPSHRPTLFADEFVKRIFLTLAGVLLVYIIFWVGTLIRNNIASYSSIGFADKMERTISFSAEGRATATPDIAITSIGMIAEGKTVQEAQTQNTEVMNKLIVGLQKIGIAKEDIRTQNYNVSPQYNYSDEGRELTGYEVNQSVSVKIRNLEHANAVFALATDVGANTVGGLDFSIDDREVYVAVARADAMEKLAKKARIVAQSIGVRLGDIVTYNEYENGGMPMYDRAYAVDAYGMGGSMAPAIEPGSSDVVLTVNVTFEIK